MTAPILDFPPAASPGELPLPATTFLRPVVRVQDGQRRVAAALGVPNVMPATVVLRADGTVAAILPQAFTSADEIAAAVKNAMR